MCHYYLFKSFRITAINLRQGSRNSRLLQKLLCRPIHLGIPSSTGSWRRLVRRLERLWDSLRVVGLLPCCRVGFDRLSGSVSGLLSMSQRYHHCQQRFDNEEL